MGKKETVFFYGWVVLIVAFITVAIANGVRFSFSVFYIEILRDFGWSRAETALAFSFGMLVHAATAPIAGVLMDRHGPRVVLPAAAVALSLGLLGMSRLDTMWQFYLLFGLVMSSATCILSPVSHAAFVYGWFDNRRGLAFSLLTAGGGLGFTMAPGIEALISVWGWRGASVALAAAVFIIVAPLTVFFQRRNRRPAAAFVASQTSTSGHVALQKAGANSRMVEKESMLQDWTVARAIRTRPFWLLIIATFFWSGELSLVQVHQIAQVTDAGYTAMFAASVFGLFGVANAVGRLCAFVSDRIGVEYTAAIGCAGGIVGASALMLVNDTSMPWLLYVYILFFGVFIGMLAPLNFAATAEIFRARNFGAIVGFMGTGWGVGSAVGAWFGGYIYDTTGSYVIAFVAGNLGLVLCGLAFWLAAPSRARSPIGVRA